MSKKLVCESLNQFINESAMGGAGYATWGGGGGGYGNPRRGRGFGSSNLSGGPNSMYTYSIVPLNRSLEPEPSSMDNEKIIHIGSVVKGKVLGKDKHVISQIIEVKEDHDNNIMYYVVLDPDTSTKIKLDPTSTYVWEPEPEGAFPAGAEFMQGSAIDYAQK